VYMRQTAWNAFDEQSIAAADGVPLRCGAITVSSDGVPYLLARSPASVMYLNGGSWATVPLTGLEGIEAQGAIAGDTALITLTPDSTGGVYVAMSLGYALENQGVYMAHVAGSELEVLVNGWSESGAYTVVGHAPQVLLLVNGTPRAVMDYFSSFDVLFTDQYLGALASVEGVHARAAAGSGGGVRAVYLDHNYNLILANLDTGEFMPIAELGSVVIDESGNGQVPWEIAVDGAWASHVLYQDQSQGAEAVLYRRIGAAGEIDEPIFVSNALATGLPGMQRYALDTDICGRATVATIEHAQDGAGASVLVVREGR
jgi:hypothetical protein